MQLMRSGSRVRGLATHGDACVLLNLADVSYVDSAGLGTMVASYLAMKRVDGPSNLLKPTRRTRPLLVITSLTTVLQSFDSEAIAVASFSAAEAS
jgi:anti-sigma B factor antagonist